MIDKIDKDNMYQSIFDFSDNMLDAVKLGRSIKFLNDYSSINKIIVAGMGGSAIGGDITYALVNDEIKIPYLVVRGYDIPTWVDSSTLVICSSYSGNTEETISILGKAHTKGAKVCAITTGCKIEKICDRYNYDKVIIHGFDFFKKSTGHYFDNKIKTFLLNQGLIKIGAKHDNILEENFVNQLINEKNVITLEEYLSI